MTQSLLSQMFERAAEKMDERIVREHGEAPYHPGMCSVMWNACSLIFHERGTPSVVAADALFRIGESWLKEFYAIDAQIHGPRTLYWGTNYATDFEEDQHYLTQNQAQPGRVLTLLFMSQMTYETEEAFKP